MIGLLPGNLKNALEKFRTDKDYGELIRSSFFALLVRGTGIVTGFLVTLLTSRYFGADALGMVSICIAILSFASVFGKLGLDVALIKFIAGFAVKNNYSGIKGVYLSALKLVVPFSLLISLVLFLLAPWMAESVFHKPNLGRLLEVNAWLTLPLVLLLIHSECIRGLKQVLTYTFLQTVAVSLFATILLLLFSSSGAKEIPSWIQFGSIIIASIVSTVAWIRSSNFLKNLSASGISQSELIGTSSSMFTTTLMQLTMSWAATLILASFVPESEVGIYNALVRISVVTNITILAINSLALPRFAESFATNSIDTMKKHAEEAARLIFLTSLPIFLVLFLFPGWILSIFGGEFQGNENALYILLFGQLIVCFCGLPSQILNMAGRQNTLRNIAIVSAIVNVISCFLLIPSNGIIGACYAQLIGTFTWNLLSTINIKRHFGFYVFFKLPENK